MKVQALILGKYDTISTFCLYRFPTPVSPPLNSPISSPPTTTTTSPTALATQVKLDQCVMYYYCLEDLERLAILAPATSFRHVNTLQLYRDYPSAFFKNVIDGYTYANNHVLYKLASCFKSKLLMGLCQLTEHTPLTERYSLLQQIPLLDTTSMAVLSSLPPTLSPFSNSLPVHLVEQVLHPVRLDGQEWFLQPLVQQHEQHQRPSPPQDEHSHYYSPVSLPNVSVTDMVSKTKESSLLLQRRLAPKLGHHAPHLTINTPAYKDHHRHSIQSAPLRKSISKQQINKRLQAAAASATTAGTNTHPSSASSVNMARLYRHHESTGVAPLQKNLESSSCNMHHSHHPSSWSAATTEKQSFLQTSEQLYDTLDQTQSQLSKLDETIRQTSTALGKLQQSSLPQRINDQVTKQMGEWMVPYLDQMEQCMGRLLMLEKKVAARQLQQENSVPVPTGQLPANRMDTNTMKTELLDLVARLDQLERKST